MLLLLGVGVVANNLLGKTKGNGSGFLFVNFGWGIAVMTGVYFASATGGHLNPAVTLGVVVRELLLGNTIDWALVGVYVVAQFLGAQRTVNQDAVQEAAADEVAHAEVGERAPEKRRPGILQLHPPLRRDAWSVERQRALC